MREHSKEGNSEERKNEDEGMKSILVLVWNHWQEFQFIPESKSWDLNWEGVRRKK